MLNLILWRESTQLVTMSAHWKSSLFAKFAIVAVLLNSACARKHTLHLEDDLRRLIQLTSFGFFEGGFMEVNVHTLYLKTTATLTAGNGKPKRISVDTIGFTLEKTVGTTLTNIESICALRPLTTKDETWSGILFELDFEKKSVDVACSPSLTLNVRVFKKPPNIPFLNQGPPIRSLRDFGDDKYPKLDNHDPVSCIRGTLNLIPTKLPSGVVSYSFSFVVYIAGKDGEGNYNVNFFHNCVDDHDSRATLNVSLVEENLKKNYLSAGKMPLPTLNLMMSVLFFMAGCFWMFILKRSTRKTGVALFNIHYLMGAVVFLKSLSLVLHSINYHYIQVLGFRLEGWAILYYITHLLKGILFYITILVIGTGYTFVKHLLSCKEKMVFMIVIPLQVLANIAQIIIAESEEAEVAHTIWTVTFVLLDLFTCCAIIFPVIWSIRDSKKGLQTLGIKAATNLRQLKLFRHFCIILVCYLYFTRIILGMFLTVALSFQYEWLRDIFIEIATFIFFLLTGYKFRPAVCCEWAPLKQ